MMSAPRVLMVPQLFRPMIGGAERQAERLALALLRRGLPVEVLTPRLHPDWPTEESTDGLQVHRFPLRDLSRIPHVRGISPVNAWYMGRQIRGVLRRFLPRFDVVHTHIANPFSSLVAVEARALGKPVVCKVASGGSYFDLTVLARESISGPRYVARLRTSVSRWVAISGQIRNDLLELGVLPEAIAAIPNGVELPAPRRWQSGAVAKRFLYLGRFPANRDFRSLLLGFEALLEHVPDAELRLVGGGDLEAELRGSVARLSRASARAEVIGFSDPRQWLAWADALVQPSYAEGLSNSLLEGMAAGLACVASDILPNREVLDQGRAGLLVPVDRPEAMAAALHRLATVPDDAAGFAEEGRRRVEEVYSLESVADRYTELYSELVGENG
jgi:glycosyltransferase involved in cell wall biosynthesis